MAACERCWRDANQRALLLGGSVTDHYTALLEERKNNPCPSERIATADVSRAIGIVLFSRSTHVAWKAYIESGKATPAEIEVAGDVSYQESRIARYDHVLAVLRSHPDAPDEPVEPLHEDACRCPRCRPSRS